MMRSSPPSSVTAIGTATVYDQVSSDGLLITTRIDALNNRMSGFADGIGRVQRMTDATAKVTVQGFDPNGNRTSVRDPNGVGMDCTFDDRNRETVCTDTQDDTTYRIYNAASQIVQTVDAVGAKALGGPSGYPASSQTLLATDTLGVETCVFDDRGRKASCTDRIAATTGYQYDDNSNLTVITDAEGVSLVMSTTHATC